ncbi:calreticulin-like [Coffea eugenioides]|uniref:calreticulin-like n=1 Tax=Coffea eugenioides TaxID=49369 RepID=UPI000F60F7FF|nr:calreticulin-like [Coffea eugenioides]XP_027162342.1 calreticulin-like [Coffea eugenioides]XP_027165763.1 calreticulin-like [Coffea eugenioides]XP_027165768.1 calreticulin-like [Coffea eugenioides]XP_027168745.1 calreticulin-like [Coffea eugenioides]XP_027183388.1 calreticulin-like [Coffea eugenioides]
MQWQTSRKSDGVKSGTLFDNVLVSDDLEYAKKLAEETWGKHKDAEKAAFDEAEKKREEEEAKDDPVDSDAEEGDDDDAADEADSDDADAKSETKEDVTAAAEENVKDEL